MIRADSKLGKAPVVLLAAKTEEKDRILRLTADEHNYISKPFNIKELVLRSKAISKRSSQSSARHENKILT